MNTSGNKDKQRDFPGNIPGNKLPEEVLFSLPDYIRGTLDDKELEERIKSELDGNPDLLKEYMKLSEVLSFVGKTNLEEPPPHYFNSLLPIINERIHAAHSKENIIFRRILSYWKYAVPVLTVFLIIIIYNIGFRNSGFRETPQFIAHGYNDSLIPEIFNNTGETIINSTDNKEMTSGETSGTEVTATEVTAMDVTTTDVSATGIKYKKIKGSKVKSGSMFDITEIFSAVTDEEFNDADEVELMSLESEFSSLPANEQSDILQKIKNL
ncbi:MAG: hypothetical protein NTV87_17755 [Ignavibacteriae bacterium]|nr:hypothetical protein [Ignavibacteriota bacterium]